MSHKAPPVPPDQQGGHGVRQPKAERGGNTKGRSDDKNLKEQDQQGNTYQNTHNQGYQQDR
jgi:hypothetical protein